MKTGKKNYLKVVVVFAFCLLARLIPFRMPNIEPILATAMPISRVHGYIFTFSFAVFSILSFDLITSTLGMQTLFTALSYGVIGIFSVKYFSAFTEDKSIGALQYARFAVFSTLFYDAMTGLTVGPLFFGQTFTEAFVGQIPFTVFHLIGNVAFAVILSPAIYHFLIRKKNLPIQVEKKDLSLITNPINLKII